MPTSLRSKALAALLAFALVFAAACGGGAGGEDSPMTEETATSGDGTLGYTAMDGIEGMTAEETAMDLSQLEVGPDEIAGMSPAEGIEKADAQPLPEDPPEGIQVYDATTNELVEGASYDRGPPTNGDHDPFWWNCGFYDEPIDEAKAVHSLDHGVVWITYSPDLPASEVETLRRHGAERYVIVSPYPEQDAPVIATSWRVQLELDGAGDPRLGQFVDQFRVSGIAPLAGNGCTKGSGEPAFSG